MKTSMIAIAAALAASGALAADWTVGENTPLTADKTVDTLTVEAGVTLDLAGYSITCSSLAGSGTVTSAAGNADLTEPSGAVTWSTKAGNATGATGGAGGNLFNNVFEWPNDASGVNNNNKRMLVAKSNLPLAVTYDFGEGEPQKVNKYKIYFARVNLGASYTARGPKAWTFEGSNDVSDDGAWVTLDSRNNVTWAQNSSPKDFSFVNNVAYRYYRITFTDSSDTSSGYLELNQLEYFNTNAGELHVNAAGGATVNSTAAITGNVKVVKEGSGMLTGITQIASAAGSTVGLVVEDGRVVVDDSTLFVGYGGAGTLTVNGGTVDVSSPDQNVNLAQQSGSSGTINLNGGTLKTRRVVRYTNGASAALNFNGGTLQANPTSNSNLTGGLVSPTVTTTVNEGGGTIDSGNLEIKVGAAIGGTGAMRFKGGNTITLEGANTYTGGTTIELGTKVVSSNSTTKDTILGGLVIDGGSQLVDAEGIEVFRYGSALTDPGDLANVALVNCGEGSTIYIDGMSIKVNFVAPAWELAADANWSDLVSTYGVPAADATVLIAASAKHTLTIDQNVTVGQLVFTGANPNVVVNSGCTITTDTINFGAANTDYYVLNNGAIVLNSTGVTALNFHNDSRGVYYVNNGRLNVSGVTDGITAPGLVPGGTNQFVCVASGAMYDVHSVTNNTASVRLASGATVANGGTTSITTGNKQIPQLILDGDATARIFRSFGLSCEGHSETRLDLGAHTLTVTGGGTTYSFFLDNTTVSGTGKILVEEGKLCAVENANGEEFTLEIGPSGQLVLDKVYARPYADFTVGNFVNNGTDSSGNDAGTLIVKGTLTPGNVVKKLALADGSTVKMTGTNNVQAVSAEFSASGTVAIDASVITRADVRAAENGRIPVLRVPSASVPSAVTWTVSGAPIASCRAVWVDNGDDTKTLCVKKPDGLMIMFR